MYAGMGRTPIQTHEPYCGEVTVLEGLRTVPRKGEEQHVNTSFNKPKCVGASLSPSLRCL